MNHRGLLYLLFAALVVGLKTSSADTVTIDLEYTTDALTWELYAQVNDTGSGNAGDHGISALRALIDNIDSANLVSGIGAIDPIDQGGPNQRDAVIVTGGDTFDILYLQDLSVPGSVVGGVGVGGRSLVMDGTFANGLAPPAFGDDDDGFTTDGNFLDVAAPGPFGNALPWDGVTLNVTDVTNVGTMGDYNGNGTVDAADYAVWLAQLGSTGAGIDADGNSDLVVDLDDYTLWKSNLGNSSGSGAGSGSLAIPEPTSALLAVIVLMAVPVSLRRE